jgi:hypothetical protein
MLGLSNGCKQTSNAARLHWESRPARRLPTHVYCVYIYVRGGTCSTSRINNLAKLQERRTHDVRPWKSTNWICNEYIHNVLHCIVA